MVRLAEFELKLLRSNHMVGTFLVFFQLFFVYYFLNLYN